jgi:hypothetical protein
MVSIPAGSNPITTASTRITQGVWLTPITAQIFYVGVDSAAASSGLVMEYHAGATNKGVHRTSLFIPINDPSRVYVHAVGGSGTVGFMYV